MSYRSIMVQMLEDDGLEARLAASVALARRFNAHLAGVHVMPPPIMPVGYGEAAAYVGPEMIEAQREANQAVADRLAARFSAAVEGSGLATAWHVDDADPATTYAARARTADLSVVPQLRQSGIDALAPELGEQLIVDAGGPVLMLPRGCGTAMGRRVVIGWSGRRESARAMRDAMPFLRDAEEIRLVTIGDAARARHEEALEALRRHDLQPKSRLLEEGDAGLALLQEATAIDADLLVMGAYGHSRLREVIFGGATHHILEHAALPVLLSC